MPSIRCSSLIPSMLIVAGIIGGGAADRITVAQPAVAAGEGVFTIADGGASLEAPATWKRVQPKSGMVETEFAIPSEGKAADGGPLPPGRMTVMGAGGSVEANIERWYGQFSQPDGGSTKDKSSTKTLKVAGRDVTLVDIVGT